MSTEKKIVIVLIIQFIWMIGSSVLLAYFFGPMDTLWKFGLAIIAALPVAFLMKIVTKV